MPREKFQHSFARKRLEENRLKFYHSGKQILTPINSNFRDTDARWEYPSMTSYIIKGMSFMPELKDKTRLMRSYEELLQKTGLIISSKSPTIQQSPYQKVEYYLCMQDGLKRDLGTIPRGHNVEVDFPNRKARLIGGNSLRKWITFQRKPPAGLGYWTRETFYGFQPSTDELMEEMFYIDKTKQEEVKIAIPEIIVGRSLEDGRIVAIPEENFNPIIFICGNRRQGKTFLHYRLLGNFYHKWRKKCIDLIDIAGEAVTHCLEWQQKVFIDKLAMIGEHTRALPLVYLTPSTNTLRRIPLEDEVGIKISLPYEEIIFDYKNIFRGEESLEFQKTFVYFQNMLFDENGNRRKDGLAKCSDIKEMKEFVKNYVTENAKLWGIGNPEGVISKIINTLQYLYNQKILDVSIGENAKWTVEEESGNRGKYNPWIACLIGDVVASINISDIVSNPVYFSYIKYILDDLFKNQTQNPLFIKNKWELFIFLNEVSSAVYDEVTKKFTPVSDILDRIIRESGPHRIGVVFGTQYLNQVSGFAKSQANYVFSFRQNEKNADELIKDYDALKDVKSDLKRLNKFQCIGFPSGSPFIMYDEEGNKEEVQDEPIKMEIFPPLSEHKPPKEI